ncbi:hypothetical protein [Sphingomonas sp. Leaf28]|uniref:hypothetical protein n=1 Tax=Sphingomonas sp. Leaf28 TaxID=1735695 RepID=UPI0012E1808C|nr:hypothetical protein [Sphingomonas sp. Leaf28]
MPVPVDAPNAADWLSAVSTAGAVVFTATVYFFDRRRSRTADRRAARRQRTNTHDIAEEALRLSKEGKDELSSYSAMNALNPAMSTKRNEELRMNVGRVMRRLNELREIASATPRLFSAIGQLSDQFSFVDGVTISSNQASVAMDCKAAVPLVEGTEVTIRSFTSLDLIPGRGTHHDT